jgi:hypothetical protein
MRYKLRGVRHIERLPRHFRSLYCIQMTGPFWAAAKRDWSSSEAFIREKDSLRWKMTVVGCLNLLIDVRE